MEKLPKVEVDCMEISCHFETVETLIVIIASPSLSPLDSLF